jgi:hypothetical protein
MVKVMDLNTIARAVTLAEGKKVQVSIAQVKEIIKIYNLILASLPLGDVAKMLNRQRRRR